MLHYICTGDCGGVSEHPGNCQDKNCPKYGAPLEACQCEDGMHHNLLDEMRDDEDVE